MNESLPRGMVGAMTSIGQRIRRLREILGLTQEQFAHRLPGVLTRGAVGNWERDKGIKRENIQIIADTFDISFEWLATGRGQEPKRDRASDASASFIDLPRVVDVVEVEIRAGGAAAGFEIAPMVTLEGTTAIAADLIRDHWGVPESFLRGELRVSSAAARIIEIYGDSMYDPGNPGAPGSLYPGDRVICDTRDRRPSPPGPFVVWDGVGLVVKLVEIVRGTDPARIRLKSRNPSYDPYDATEDEAVIIGRVRGRISAM